MPLGRNPNLPIVASPGGGGGGSTGTTTVVASPSSPDEWLDVADFIGDGVDDNDAVQDAVIAAQGNYGGSGFYTGGVVIMAPGEYHFTDVVTDEGADADSIIIQGFPQQTWVAVDSQPTETFKLTANGSQLRGVNVYDDGFSPTSSDRAVSLDGYDQVVVDCELLFGGGAAVYVSTNAQKAKIVRSTLEGLHGIYADRDNFAVSDSSIAAYGSASAGVYLATGGGVNGRDGALIANNRFAGGRALYAPSGGGAMLISLRFIGNNCGGTDGNNYCIELISSGTYGECLIANNTLHGVFGGIKLNNVLECSVVDNYIKFSEEHGIWLLDSDDCTVIGNQVLCASQATDDTYSGIILDGDTNRCNVQGNICRRDTGSTSTTNKPKYGIRIDDATCDDNYVTNNDLKNSAKSGGSGGAYSDAGTGTVTTAGNRT